MPGKRAAETEGEIGWERSTVREALLSDTKSWLHATETVPRIKPEDPEIIRERNTIRQDTNLPIFPLRDPFARDIRNIVVKVIFLRLYYF